MEWTTELTVGFVPLPPEKEELYWAAIRYFAEVMFADLLEPGAAAEPTEELYSEDQDLSELGEA